MQVARAKVHFVDKSLSNEWGHLHICRALLVSSLVSHMCFLETKVHSAILCLVTFTHRIVSKYLEPQGRNQNTENPVSCFVPLNIEDILPKSNIVVSVLLNNGQNSITEEFQI